jgi:site-specific recombinase XerC
MSEKYRLHDTPFSLDLSKRPRSSAEHVKMYVRKEGEPRALKTAKQAGEKDRRYQVALTVARNFCKGTGPAALACEPLLIDALQRWLVTCCRTHASWTTYGARMHYWIARTDRRSLTAQIDVSPSVVSDYLFGLEAAGASPRTIVSHREVLRSWFAWLFDRDLVRRSPVSRDLVRAFRIDHGKVEKADGSRQAFTAGEAQRIADWCLQEASAEAGLSVLLQLTGGLRSEEVAALERRHLVEADGVVTLSVPGKGQKLRKIEVEEVAVAAWRRYLQLRRRQGNRGALLVAPGGGHYHPRTVQRWAKQAAAVVGRPQDISSHDFRATAATLLCERGADLADVQVQLGHASIETTKRCYVRRRAPLRTRTGLQISTDTKELP